MKILASCFFVMLIGQATAVAQQSDSLTPTGHTSTANLIPFARYDSVNIWKSDTSKGGAEFLNIVSMKHPVRKKAVHEPLRNGQKNEPPKLDVDDWADIVASIVGVVALIFSTFTYVSTLRQFRLINQSYLNPRFVLAYRPAGNGAIPPGTALQNDSMIDGIQPFIDLHNVGKLPMKYRVKICLIDFNGAKVELVDDKSDFVENIIFPGQTVKFNTRIFELENSMSLREFGELGAEFYFKAEYQDIGAGWVKAADRRVKFLIENSVQHVRELSIDDQLTGKKLGFEL